MKIAPEDRVKVKLACLEMLVGLRLDYPKRRLVSGFVDTYLRLNQTEQTEFKRELEQTVAPPQREELMELTTSWKEEGIVEGRMEGELEAHRRMVRRLLSRRIGELNLDQLQMLNQLSTTQLEDLGDSLLDFSGLSSLDEWLSKNANSSPR